MFLFSPPKSYYTFGSLWFFMTRKRVTTTRGNRVVAYTTKREALRAKDRAPRADRVRKLKQHRTRSGVKKETLWVVEKAGKFGR